MSNSGDNNQPLLGLTSEEIEVECLIRRIPLTVENYEQLLLETLKEEGVDPSKVPTNTHTNNYQDELSLCKKQSTTLSSQLNMQALKCQDLRALENQIKHWRGRTQRLKGRFHQDNDVDKLLNQFRRLKQVLEVRREEVFEKQPDPTSQEGQKSVSEPTVTFKATQVDQTQMPWPITVPPNPPTTLLQPFVSMYIPNVQPTHATQTTWVNNPQLTRCSPNILPSFTNFYQNPATQFLTIPSNTSNLPVDMPNRIQSEPRSVSWPNHDLPYSTRTQQARNDLVLAPEDSKTNRPFSPYVVRDPKWNISFSGQSDGLDVHDFVFRLETLASKENVTLNRLDALMPKLLVGTAEKWYWVFVRKFPNASYFQLRQAILDRFSTMETDRSLRRFIQNKRQTERETNRNYILEMESLNGRLVKPFSEGELVEIIRDNMGISYREVTLSTPAFTADELRIVCEQFEKLWASKSRQTAFVRHPKFVNEVIGEPTYSAYPSRPQTHLSTQPEPTGIAYLPDVHLEALTTPRSSYRKTSGEARMQTNFIVCWNFRDLGHRYQDCTLPPQGVFCYGCGKSGVIKPQCTHCTTVFPGNRQPGVSNSGSTRPVHLISRLPQQENPTTTQTADSASNTEPSTYR